jgi:benzoyl-CoA reductase/2-hydroxyglutaryl-CoA dehydratase subunit BcrC/BadD/HgdB
MKELIAAALYDKDVDGIVLPNSCDCVRTSADYIKREGLYVYQLKHPLVQTEAAVRYFALVIERFKCSLEEYFHQTISFETIALRTELIHEKNLFLREIYENADSFIYSDYLEKINQMLSHPLSEWKLYTPASSSHTRIGKKIYIIGPFLTQTDIISQMEQCGLIIAGDNLTNSKRLITKSFSIREDTLYEDIARSILNECASPTISQFCTLYEKDYEEIVRKGIRGVVFLCTKFCESYDYLFAFYQKRLQDTGIPVIRVYTDNAEYENNTVWETFYQMI